MIDLWEEAPQTAVLGVHVYSFGIYCALGSLAAATAVLILSRASGRKKGTGLLLATLSIFFGLAGARLFYCLLNHPGNGTMPFSEWFHLSTGGFSLFGMILGAFFAAWVCALLTGEKKTALLDITASALPLAIAAERFGERLFEGFDTSRSVMGTFPAGTFLAVEDAFYGTSALATWLVSAISAVALFLILTFRLLRVNREDGDQWIIFLLLCGAGGVVLESLRYDYHLEYSFVYLQQVIAAILLVWGVILAGRRGKRKRLFAAAIITLIIAVAVAGGVEFALDRLDINHILLYLIMTASLAVPVTLGLILLQRKGLKGTERI